MTETHSAKRDTIPDLLAGLITHPPFAGKPRLSIGEIIHFLHERGFGMVLILLSLPSAIPGCPPPIPSLFAMPLCIIAYQMLRGYDAPALPEKISRKTLSVTKLAAIIKRFNRYYALIDGIITPRLLNLTSSKAEKWLGLIILLFGGMVLIPLPLTNTVPSIGIIFIAMGILSRDGLLVIIGTIIGFVWAIMLLLLSQQLISWVAS